MKEDYLYHYTNIYSLASILRHKSIRFSPLNKMDDMEDGKTRDFENINKYVFCSSWTDLKDEQIPFWSMYTNNMHGVRIGLPKYPFENYRWEHPAFEKSYYISQNQAIHENYFIAPHMNKDVFLTKIEYSDNEYLSQPCINEKSKDFLITHLSKVGQRKKEAWRFQSEWRYRLFCFPGHCEEVIKGKNSNKVRRCMEKGVELPFSFVDLKIRQECFEKMEILTGPKMTDEEKVFIKLLVKEYATSLSNNLFSSNLKIR